VAQTLSIKYLSPPSDDPAIQKTQRILGYLPWLLGYFALSVPAGLGCYWVINNFLSTAATVGIKAYFKSNPSSVSDIDLDKLANSQMSAYMNPAWGYKSPKDMYDEAVVNYRPSQSPLIPEDYQAKI
jgi:hypothetical protein